MEKYRRADIESIDKFFPRQLRSNGPPIRRVATLKTSPTFDVSSGGSPTVSIEGIALNFSRIIFLPAHSLTEGEVPARKGSRSVFKVERLKSRRLDVSVWIRGKGKGS